MPFRDDLDLSGILNKFEAFGGMPAIEGRLVERRVPLPRPGEGEDPDRAESHGPDVCSTSRVLGRSKRLWAWDPNRYYRDLGVPWPYVNATRKDLRLAYQALDGQRSERLTYCFKQLLTKREEYDEMPLGHLFMDDIYVQAYLRRKAREEAERRNRGVFDQDRFDEVLEEMGFVALKEEDETGFSPRSLDESRHYELDDGTPEIGPSFHYGYYLWKTTETREGLLSQWQAALIRAIDMDVPNLTVGLMGKNHSRYAVVQTAGRWVVFIHQDAEVTEELALLAKTALMKSLR